MGSRGELQVGGDREGRSSSCSSSEFSLMALLRPMLPPSPKLLMLPPLPALPRELGLLNPVSPPPRLETRSTHQEEEKEEEEEGQKEDRGGSSQEFVAKRDFSFSEPLIGRGRCKLEGLGWGMFRKRRTFEDRLQISRV